MEVNIYGIYDTVAEQYGPLFEAKNDGVAQRNFEQLTKDTQYGSEYDLYRLGSFNHDTGQGSFTEPAQVRVTLSQEVQNDE